MLPGSWRRFGDIMFKTLSIACAGLIFAGAASAQVLVAPSVRSDGTYVQGHMRSAPDGNRMNNYSTQGNVNPYTGQAGTVNPYNQPPAVTFPTPSYQQAPQRMQTLPNMPRNAF